jgi:hypothetical protein
VSVRIELARNPSAQPHIIEELAHQPEPAVQAAVAGNRSTSETLLTELMSDGHDETVKVAVARNETATASMLATLATGSDALKLAVTENKSTSVATLRTLTNDASGVVRMAAVAALHRRGL